jgi:hypothetical protein
VAAVVGGAQKMDKVDFLFTAGDHGGVVGAGFDDGHKWKSKSVVECTFTSLEILERHDAPEVIDYLSLGVEGAEEFIMQNFPLSTCKIRVIAIERPRDGLRKILMEHKYQQVMRLSQWGETMWVHQDCIKDCDAKEMHEFDAKVQRQKKAQDKQCETDKFRFLLK